MNDGRDGGDQGQQRPRSIDRSIRPRVLSCHPRPSLPPQLVPGGKSSNGEAPRLTPKWFADQVPAVPDLHLPPSGYRTPIPGSGR